MVIICYGGLGFVFGVALWVVGINTPLIDYNMNYDSMWETLLPISSIPTVLGGFIGYRISRLRTSAAVKISIIVGIVAFVLLLWGLREADVLPAWVWEDSGY